MSTRETVVHCSSPGCSAPASLKIAAPWQDGSFRELKTYGFSCPEHSAAMVDYARKRPRPSRLAPGESVGEVAAFEIKPS